MINVRMAFALALLLVFGTRQPARAAASGPAGVGGESPAKAAQADAPQQLGKEFEKILQPVIAEAQKAYPAARDRFLAGLPPGQRFFVTVAFTEKGVRENAFMQVQGISGGAVRATVATKLTRISSHPYGEEMVFPESEVLDWTIVSPDGKEEGNFVGKFLDEYSRKRP